MILTKEEVSAKRKYATEEQEWDIEDLCNDWLEMEAKIRELEKQRIADARLALKHIRPYGTREEAELHKHFKAIAGTK